MQARVYPPYSPNVAPGKMERRHTCASNQGCIHILLCYQIIFPQLAFNSSLYCLIDCESFARRTFTNPKIRTFTNPKFGHFPPPQKNICQEDNCHPQFFSSFFGAFFLAFSTYSSWRSRDVQNAKNLGLKTFCSCLDATEAFKRLRI